MTDHASPLRTAENQLAQAVMPYIATLGLNRQAVAAGARAAGFSEAEASLIAPNGAADIAAILWRMADDALDDPDMRQSLAAMKIRERIGFLLNLRLDAAAVDGEVARHLMGFFALPGHAVLYHRLLWATADRIWRLAGDVALDENHYSKRAIVCGILTTALMTRLTQEREAQTAQIARNIEQVMAFEKFKAKLPKKPEDLLLDLGKKLGRWRFGSVRVGETA
ncbi:COQ9 family protein [Asticcacaulis sp. EMRT-3]|uniref:COQ9 family protein n=1 Tax=Asticcacaulis sp. EMRT-3 TaxID=3040349 RepID=UPI0024AF4301|nr:COQ9 family protein [Asticcacaulis sp. EMRT-3]MDI7774269.1 COQ9 family protein [Asticcacaulis sp. EMRT-3]